MKVRLQQWLYYVSTAAILLQLVHVALGRSLYLLGRVSFWVMMLWLVLWLWHLWLAKQYKLMAAVLAVLAAAYLLVRLV